LPFNWQSAIGNRQQATGNKKFVEALHFCLFEVAGDTCRMTAIDHEGKQIDQTTFKARAVPAGTTTGKGQ